MPRPARPVRFTVLFPVVTLAASAALADRLGAQAPAPAPGYHLVVGAGADAMLRDGREATPSLALHAGVERRLGTTGLTSRLGVRLATDYWTRRQGLRTTYVNGEPWRTEDRSGRAQAASLGVWGTAALANAASADADGAPAAGRLRPYVLAGLGVQHAWSHFRNPGSPGSPELGIAPRAPGVDRVRYTGLLLGTGLGLGVRLGPVEAVAEARLTVLPAALRSPWIAPRAWYAPLTAGLRF